MAEKINSFYVSGTDKIRPDLFNEFAEKVAKGFSCVKNEEYFDKKTQAKKYKEVRNGVTSTQIRRLFDEIKRYERLINDDDCSSWEKQYPYIKMIKSKVHYTVARSKKNGKREDAIYYDNLSQFISEGIDLIKSAKDYHIFVSLFEAVYGFYYENRPDVKN